LRIPHEDRTFATKMKQLGKEQNLIKVGQMKRSEAPAASQLIRRVISRLNYYNARARREELAKYTHAHLLRMQSEDSDSILVAHIGECLAGFCLSRYDDGVIWLSWFGVDGVWRQKGIGTALLEALESTVRCRKCHKMWCDTRTVNLKSQKSLKKAGFKRICELERHCYGQDFYLWQKLVG
jgi:ribosomal protein S18 acetylase RimI-like enzyme